jgi:hypothetical protein
MDLYIENLLESTGNLDFVTFHRLIELQKLWPKCHRMHSHGIYCIRSFLLLCTRLHIRMLSENGKKVIQ